MPGEGIINWEWTEQREKAAFLTSGGRLTQSELASECDVHVETIKKWGRSPEFQRRVDEHLEAVRLAILKTGIGNPVNRARRLTRDWLKAQKVIEARELSANSSVPGDDTGLLCSSDKVIGQGENAREVTEYRVDVALLKELREMEEAAAREFGQRVDRQDITSGGNPVTPVFLAGMSKVYGDDPGDAE
jgi:hypothetical protein